MLVAERTNNHGNLDFNYCNGVTYLPLLYDFLNSFSVFRKAIIKLSRQAFVCVYMKLNDKHAKRRNSVTLHHLLATFFGLFSSVFFSNKSNAPCYDVIIAAAVKWETNHWRAWERSNLQMARWILCGRKTGLTQPRNIQYPTITM